MRRTILLACAVLVISADAATAQKTAWAFGPGIGATISTFVGDDVEEAKTRTTAYYAFLAVKHGATSPFGLETGLMYVDKGAATDSPDGAGSLQLRYIEIPLVLRIGMNLGPSVRPIIKIGPSIGINMGCTLEARDDNSSLRLDCDSPAISEPIDVKLLDFGMSGALAADIRVGANVITPTVRYVRGFSSAFDANEGLGGTNSAFMIGASIRFIR